MVPEQVAPDVVIPEPQPVIDIPGAEGDLEPAILAPVVAPKMDDEDIDEDEELEMDLEESNKIDEGQIIEDIDAVAPRSIPATDIAQITAVQAVEMAAQLDGSMIRDEELAGYNRGKGTCSHR